MTYKRCAVGEQMMTSRQDSSGTAKLLNIHYKQL